LRRGTRRGRAPPDGTSRAAPGGGARRSARPRSDRSSPAPARSAERDRTGARTTCPGRRRRAPSPRELRRTPRKSKSRARGSPSTGFSWSSAHYARRDDAALALARALVDLGDPRVAVVPLDGELGRIPVAAVDLDGLVRDPGGGLA